MAKPKPGKRPKKLPAIRTERPDPADPAPVLAYRFGAAVVVRIPGPSPAVLTPAEANELAAVLILQSDLARRTPNAGTTKQLPDE